MAPAGFEPTIPARERPQIHALDRAVTSINEAHSFSKTSRFNVFL